MSMDRRREEQKRRRRDNNLTDPGNPLSPFNPANPASPFNPINQPSIDPCPSPSPSMPDFSC